MGILMLEKKYRKFFVLCRDKKIALKKFEQSTMTSDVQLVLPQNLAVLSIKSTNFTEI
jgi:hypothetical protein